MKQTKSGAPQKGFVLWILFLAFWAIFGCGTLNSRQGAQSDETIQQAQPTRNVSLNWLITDVGGRVDWSADGKLIAYDRINEDSYFDTWTMEPDGMNQQCLTCDDTILPQEHVGNPAWHPSREYLVVQALDETQQGPLAGTSLYQVYTNPGAGFHNDLWLVSHDGKHAWQLTSVQAESVGVLHPHFSNDGARLLWAEMVSTEPRLIGSWVIRLADFVFEQGEPHLQNVLTLTPGDMQWYETHGFSPDDQRIIFTGMPFGGREKDFDIYTYDLQTLALEKLTDSSLQQWDEHAHFLPDGSRIMWMSSMDMGQEADALNQFEVKTDYWIMNADGSNKQRLTFFNEPGAPEYIAGQVIAADFSFNPDGTQVVAYVQHNPQKDKPGSIVILHLTE